MSVKWETNTYWKETLWGLNGRIIPLFTQQIFIKYLLIESTLLDAEGIAGKKQHHLKYKTCNMVLVSSGSLALSSFSFKVQIILCSMLSCAPNYI